MREWEGIKEKGGEVRGAEEGCDVGILYII